MIDADELLARVRARRAEDGDDIPAPRADQARLLADLIRGTRN
ncbi:hypothetical protein [Gordonia sp. QH-12]|nr:hypothetical protein [Gordonia sp. QH-12]